MNEHGRDHRNEDARAPEVSPHVGNRKARRAAAAAARSKSGKIKHDPIMGPSRLAHAIHKCPEHQP